MIIRKAFIKGLVYVVTNKNKNYYEYRINSLDQYPKDCDFYILNPQEPLRNISWKGSIDKSDYMMSVGKDNLNFCRIVPGDIIIKSSSKELLKYSLVDELTQEDMSIFDTLLDSPIKYKN